MDFEEIWSEHKPFISMVGVGLIVLLVFQGVKTAVYADDTRRSTTAAARNLLNLKREKVVRRSDLHALEDETSALTARLKKLEGQVELSPPPAYVLPETNVKSTFTRVVQNTRDKVAEVAALKNVRIPYELGVPSITPNTREEMARYLLGLYVVERVVTYAVEEGVRRFESIEVKPGRGSGFVTETRVTFRVSTDGVALAALVDRILDPADPLMVSEFHVAHPPRGGGLTATIGISILEVNGDKPLGEEGAG